jgi:DNA-binding SARP family transcriptional activator
MRIEVLGPMKLTVHGRIIWPAGQRQRALLAALTLEFGKVVPVDRLVDVLWDADPPASARVKVQAHVSSLRYAIGNGAWAGDGPLVTRPPGYVLCREGIELDLAEFDALIARGKEAADSPEPTAASEFYGAALALWRGSAFADVRSPLIRGAADSLEDQHQLAWEAKAEADLALGRCDRVVAELPRWLAAHPFRERMRAMLMLALYRLGCRADALVLYRDGYQLMVAELGLEPGPQLRALHQRILADDPLLLAQPARCLNGTAAGAMRARVASDVGGQRAHAQSHPPRAARQGNEDLTGQHRQLTPGARATNRPGSRLLPRRSYEAG